MSKTYYFNTGINCKDTIQVRMDYNKDAGGYAAVFCVGDRRDGQYFGWHIDADYFNFYQKPSIRLLAPCGRRSAKKEQEAAEMLEANLLDYVKEFAVASEALGAPHMEISVAA